MLTIGVTGGSGSGKTTFLRVAAARGAQVLDCDEIYHHLLATSPALLAEIEARFPGTVVAGALERKALGRRVFSDPAALQDLNAITHRYVAEAVEREMHGALVVIDAIALFESGLAARCDVTVCVTAPEDKRVARLMAREGIPADYARARIRAQKPDAYYSALADYTLLNDYETAEAFRTAGGHLLDEICARH